MERKSPRVLGIDDAPFRKRQEAPVPIVAAVMEGRSVLEGVAIGSFPVDGEGAAEYLAGWIGGMRWLPSLQAVLLGGATIAGLGIVDIRFLADRLGMPVLSVTRAETENADLAAALRAAGLEGRIRILERLPASLPVLRGVFVAHAGTSPEDAAAIVRSTLHVSRVPEPVRVAHLIGAALVTGASRGRV